MSGFRREDYKQAK